MYGAGVRFMTETGTLVCKWKNCPKLGRIEATLEKRAPKPAPKPALPTSVRHSSRAEHTGRQAKKAQPSTALRFFSFSADQVTFGLDTD